MVVGVVIIVGLGKGINMNKTYEYCATKILDGIEEDYIIQLTVGSLTSQKALGRYADSDADCYGYTEMEYEADEDLDWMSDSQRQTMEEWLTNEHTEYLQDQAYYL